MSGRRSQAERSCTPTLGARTPRPRTPALLTRHTATRHSSQRCAELSSPRALESSWGSHGNGRAKRGSEFSSLAPLPQACVPATRSRLPRTQFPGSLPFAQQTRLVQPLPRGSLGNCVPPRHPTAASVRSATWKALVWRGGEKAFVVATDLLIELMNGFTQRLESRPKPLRQGSSCFPVGKLLVALSIMPPNLFFLLGSSRSAPGRESAHAHRARSRARGVGVWAPAHVTNCPVVLSRPRIPVAGRIS